MATDTARIKLELASGKNEITAPYHNTAQRRRNKHEQDVAASVDAPAEPPAAAQVIVAVPPAPEPESIHPRPGTVARTPWIAFAVALVAVAGAVWWVMFQRLPDIDPRDVIERNLADAQAAMADGRYTDPLERSALHYYSTVLALDPRNAAAIAGIDAIADRHITNARVLLDEHRVAEAGVALEKARRVRPEHTALPALDAQWRTELRKILASGAAIPKPAETLPPVKQAAVKKPDVAASRRPSLAPALAAPTRATHEPMVSGEAPRVHEPASEPAAAANRPHTSPASIAEPPASVATSEETSSVSAAPEPPVSAAEPFAQPKRIKMVQPQYPPEAAMRGIEGWVDVSLQVSAAGDVIDPRIEGGNRGRMFNRAALHAVQQWKYEPRNDGSTSERMYVRLQFRRSN